MRTVQHPRLGWFVKYEQGTRLADLFAPDGSCVDCVQVRDWNWSRSPWEQKPITVSDADLIKALEQYLDEQGFVI